MAEAAASLFLSLILFVSLQFLPVVGMVLAVFAPAPLAVLCIHRGESVFLGATLVALTLEGVLFGGGGAGLFLLVVGVPAFVIARGLAFGWRPEVVVGVPALVVTGAAFVTAGRAGPDGMRGWIEQSVQQLVAAYRQSGVPPETIQQMEQSAGFMVDVLHRISPLMFIWAGAAVALCSLMAARLFFSRRPDPSVSLAPLDRWFLPDAWVWGLIASGVLVLVPNHAARTAGLNLLGVMFLVYACQGWAVVAHFFRTRQVHAFVQAVFYLGLLLLWPLSLILVAMLVALGVFDVWADTRRVRGSGEAAGMADSGGDGGGGPA